MNSRAEILNEFTFLGAHLLINFLAIELLNKLIRRTLLNSFFEIRTNGAHLKADHQVHTSKFIRDMIVFWSI